MIFSSWANRWGVPADAIRELTTLLGAADIIDRRNATGSEAAVQAQARLTGSKLGWRLWRNNVGAAQLDNGSFVRYGLCNDSKAVNSKLKSSDLIGVRPIDITKEHVGQRIGQFVALELKKPAWTFKGTPREIAQLRYIGLVSNLGGYAKFLRNPDELTQTHP